MILLQPNLVLWYIIINVTILRKDQIAIFRVSPGETLCGWLGSKHQLTDYIQDHCHSDGSELHWLSVLYFLYHWYPRNQTRYADVLLLLTLPSGNKVDVHIAHWQQQQLAVSVLTMGRVGGGVVFCHKLCLLVFFCCVFLHFDLKPCLLVFFPVVTSMVEAFRQVFSLLCGCRPPSDVLSCSCRTPTQRCPRRKRQQESWRATRKMRVGEGKRWRRAVLVTDGCVRGEWLGWRGEVGVKL